MNQVTPGLWGFIITFCLAVAVLLLVRSMTRRIRRVRYRAQVLEEAAGADRPVAPVDSASPFQHLGGKYGPGARLDREVNKEMTSRDDRGADGKPEQP